LAAALRRPAATETVTHHDELGASTDSGMIIRAHCCLPMPSGRPGNDGSAGFAQSGSADRPL